MVQLAIMGFVFSDGLQQLTLTIWASYKVLPVGQYEKLAIEHLPALTQALAGELTRATFYLFGPFLVMFLLLEFGIGLTGKLAQQLKVNDIAAPMKSMLFPLLLLALLANPAYIRRPVEESLRMLKQFAMILVNA